MSCVIILQLIVSYRIVSAGSCLCLCPYLYRVS